MTLLDTNYILRWFLGDVPRQATVAGKLLSGSEPDSLLVDRVHLAEVTYVLRLKGYDHGQIAGIFQALYAYPAVRAARPVDELALQIYARTNLDFEDCLLAAYHQSKGYHVATFDAALQKRLKHK